jgi:hypothetical protein
MAIAQMIFPLKRISRSTKISGQIHHFSICGSVQKSKPINAMNATTKTPCAGTNETVIKSNNYANHHGMKYLFCFRNILSDVLPEIFFLA